MSARDTHKITSEMVSKIAAWATNEPLILSAWIFGSRVHGSPRLDSDLDIAVEVRRAPNDTNEEATFILNCKRWENSLEQIVDYSVHLLKAHPIKDPVVWSAIDLGAEMRGEAIRVKGQGLASNTLRCLYRKATLRQRFSVFRQFIDNASHSPVLGLLAHVSAIEAACRASIYAKRIARGENEDSVYKEIKNGKPLVLLKELTYLYPASKNDSLNCDSLLLDLTQAVDERNLIIHECTYRSQSVTKPLLDSLSLIFSAIEKRVLD